ncbi:MAG: hypothetical protein U0457_03410 [Candidatus Sericytochromatia bacterium]
MNKLKILNLFLVNLVIFTSFSCNNVEKVKEKEPMKEVIKESLKPSAIILSTPTPTSTPITSPSILETVNNSIQPSTIPSKTPYPPLPEKFLNKSELRDMGGAVIDFEGKPLEGVTVIAEIIKFHNEYEYTIKTKTDKDGKFNFLTFPELNFFIKAVHNNYTARNIMGYSQGLHSSLYDKTHILIINKSPEINEVIFNKNNFDYSKLSNSPKNYLSIIDEYPNKDSIKKYIDDYFKFVYLSNVKYNNIIMLKDILTDNIVKIKKTKNISIELKFNGSINKSSFEENFIIKELTSNKDIFYFTNPNTKFEWFENNTKVIINLDTSKIEIGNYKISFKKPFEDNYGNKYLDKRAICLSDGDNYTRCSENIIFKIEE